MRLSQSAFLHYGYLLAASAIASEGCKWMDTSHVRLIPTPIQKSSIDGHQALAPTFLSTLMARSLNHFSAHC